MMTCVHGIMASAESAPASCELRGRDNGKAGFPMRDESSIPTKVCTACGCELPATTEFFYAHSGGRPGFRARCIACFNEDVNGRQAKRRVLNPEAERASDREWYALNRERILAAKAAYRDEHRQQSCDASSRWRERHPEDASRYYTEHREQSLARVRNRRARLGGSGGIHTAADVRAQYDRQHGRCYWCGVKVGTRYHVDHVWPVAKGGSNGPENLVIACPDCNRSKGAKPPTDLGRLC